MGNTGDGARFTVIDTPGFGDRLIEEEKRIESLVQVLIGPQLYHSIIPFNYITQLLHQLKGHIPKNI